MRVFLAVLVLIFSLQSWTKADDIRDLQIEGMSIGDSLLDYFSKEEIKKAKPVTNYKDKKYRTLNFVYVKKNFETYEVISASFKSKDINYTIVGVGGFVVFDNNFEACSLQQDEIYNEFDKIIKGKKISSEDKALVDKSGQSKIRQTGVLLENGDLVQISCYKYGKKFKKENPVVDHMRVSIFTRDYSDWLNNIAYK